VGSCPCVFHIYFSCFAKFSSVLDPGGRLAGLVGNVGSACEVFEDNEGGILGWLRGTVGRTSVFDRRTFPVLRSTCS